MFFFLHWLLRARDLKCEPANLSVLLEIRPLGGTASARGTVHSRSLDRGLGRARRLPRLKLDDRGDQRRPESGSSVFLTLLEERAQGQVASARPLSGLTNRPQSPGLLSPF